jgi:hypothetical protein
MQRLQQWLCVLAAAVLLLVLFTDPINKSGVPGHMQQHTHTAPTKTPKAAAGQQNPPANTTFRCGAQVTEQDVQHIATDAAVCDPHGAAGLALNATDSQLVAPVVIVGHNRPGYLAKTVISLMK